MVQWVGRVFFSKNKKKRPCIRHILVGNPSSGFSHVSLIKSRVCKREEKDKKITTIIHTFCICGATNIIYTYIYNTAVDIFRGDFKPDSWKKILFAVLSCEEEIQFQSSENSQLNILNFSALFSAEFHHLISKRVWILFFPPFFLILFL